jgi:glycine cleavage system regulatory protein
MASLVLILVGPDRPGLVSRLSELVVAHGGNWLESRMARLAGQFAGIALVDVPEARAAGLRAAVAGLAEEGCHVAVQSGQAPVPHEATSLRLELVGNDRPGILRAITAALAGRGVNIEELTTRVESGSFSGGALFRAEAALRAPAGCDVADLRRDLEGLGEELMVEITVGGAPPLTA